MQLSNFIKGLLILQPYYHNGDGFHIGAEHDEFYAYQTDLPLTPDDVKTMVELGWFQIFGGAGHCDGEYIPENGWSAYV